MNKDKLNNWMRMLYSYAGNQGPVKDGQLAALIHFLESLADLGDVMVHQSLLLPEFNKFHIGNGSDGKHYWLTPEQFDALLDLIRRSVDYGYNTSSDTLIAAEAKARRLLTQD